MRSGSASVGAGGGEQRPPFGGDRLADALGRGFVHAPLLRAAASRPAPLLGRGQRPVLETRGERPAVGRDRALAGGEDEAALPAVGFLDVVLLGVGGGDLEADAPRRRARPDVEDVGGVVLRRLDVVLVGVGPVQLHLFAVIGDQIGRPAAGDVAALRDEIALRVVAGEEGGEAVVYVGLGVGVLLGPGEPRALPGPGQAQRPLHLGEQVAVEERAYLRRLDVHDPVEAEIEVAAVELEHLAQQGLEPVEILAGRWRGRIFLHVPGSAALGVDGGQWIVNSSRADGQPPSAVRAIALETPSLLFSPARGGVGGPVGERSRRPNGEAGRAVFSPPWVFSPPPGRGEERRRRPRAPCPAMAMSASRRKISKCDRPGGTPLPTSPLKGGGVRAGRGEERRRRPRAPLPGDGDRRRAIAEFPNAITLHPLPTIHYPLPTIHSPPATRAG